MTFWFYRFFLNTKDAHMALFKAKLFMTLLLFIHLLTILLVTDLFEFIPIEKHDSRGKKQFVIFLIMLSIYILLTLIARKKHMLDLNEQHKEDTPAMIKKAKHFLIAYMAGSFALVMVLAIWLRT